MLSLTRPVCHANRVFLLCRARFTLAAGHVRLPQAPALRHHAHEPDRHKEALRLVCFNHPVPALQQGSTRSVTMKKLFAVALIAAFASNVALAGAECKPQPKDKWQKEADFKKKLTAEGYQIKKFKVSGNCYEIYGKNKDGKKVEIYVDPVSGAPVKTDIED
jgi:hypothetical protein